MVAKWRWLIVLVHPTPRPPPALTQRRASQRVPQEQAYSCGASAARGEAPEAAALEPVANPDEHHVAEHLRGVRQRAHFGAVHLLPVHRDLRNREPESLSDEKEVSSNMLGGASQTVSKIRVKCNGK